MISPTCEAGVNGLIPGRTNCETAWDASSSFIGPTLVPLEQSWLHDSHGVSRARFACAVEKIGLL